MSQITGLLLRRPRVFVQGWAIAVVMLEGFAIAGCASTYQASGTSAWFPVEQPLEYQVPPRVDLEKCNLKTFKYRTASGAVLLRAPMLVQTVLKPAACGSPGIVLDEPVW